MADQQSFAEASGDVNPIHMNATAARRSQAGAVVVHGMHGALWALEGLAAAEQLSLPIGAVRITFNRFLYLNDRVELRATRRSATTLKAVLSVSGMAVTTITISADVGNSHTREHITAETRDIRTAPLDLSFRETTKHICAFEPVAGRSTQLFPHLAATLGAKRVEGFAALSTVVGMYCPGAHSIFASADIALDDVNRAGVAFKTSSHDDRFQLVELDVEGSGIFGKITAFASPPPVEQPGLEVVSGAVSKGEFTNVSALIVGGSRGLGAMVAKIIIAGGGSAAITYAYGKDDALAVAHELGRSISVRRHDVTKPAQPQLAQLDKKINQLYYFATPRIRRQRSREFQTDLFKEFCEYYVDGFYDMCTALAEYVKRDITVFYPSSIAVTEHPKDLFEYAMAKAAGEVVCAHLNSYCEHVRAIISRLPALDTDQNAVITGVDTGDALSAMLPIVRQM